MKHFGSSDEQHETHAAAKHYGGAGGAAESPLTAASISLVKPRLGLAASRRPHRCRAEVKLQPSHNFLFTLSTITRSDSAVQSRKLGGCCALGQTALPVTYNASDFTADRTGNSSGPGPAIR